MNAVAQLHPVHSLSVLTPDSCLRERQILMLQQALHNAQLPTPKDRLLVIEACIGRPIGSLGEVRVHELRQILAHVKKLTPQPHNA